MLLANPQLHADVFDLMRWNYSRPVVELLQMRFGASRVQTHAGYSWDTLPPWIDASRRRGHQCDFLFVDGGHSEKAARQDLIMFRSVAAPGARVIVDDTNVGNEPGTALRRLAKQRALAILESYDFKKRSEHNPCQRKPEGRTLPCKEWGFSVARYTDGTLSKEAAASADGA